MKRLLPLLAAASLLFVIPAPARAALKTADVFGDRMVLQRGQPIEVWGSADPGAKVAVTLGEASASANADGQGSWKASLPAREAAGPFELKVAAGAETQVFKDVMVGDLWLASGQSNMVLSLQATTEWPEVKAAGTFPMIRVCKLPGDFSFSPEDHYHRPVRWEVLDSARVGYFSAVAYHFARTVQPGAGIAIGVIQGASGGTQAEQWTPEEALRAALPSSPHFAARDAAKAKASETPSAKISSSGAGAAALYNGTIHPLRFLHFAGVVWYQGEANSRTRQDYVPVLRTLVASWRSLFGEPQLPFVVVQLPAFGLAKGDGWMRLREAQRTVAGDPGVALAVTIDLGSKTTIHPSEKAEVGRRAGLAALQKVYGQQVEGTAPAFKSAEFGEGGVAVTFDGFAGNLVVRGDAVRGFEVAGADGKFVPAEAAVEGRTVTVKAAGVARPEAVRYLWAAAPDVVTLYSEAGLPAGPFAAGKGGKTGVPPPAPDAGSAKETAPAEGE